VHDANKQKERGHENFKRILAIAAAATTGAQRKLSRVSFDAIAGFPNHQFSSSFELAFGTNLVPSHANAFGGNIFS
jgi:hypothetical protein